MNLRILYLYAALSMLCPCATAASVSDGIAGHPRLLMKAGEEQAVNEMLRKV